MIYQDRLSILSVRFPVSTESDDKGHNCAQYKGLRVTVTSNNGVILGNVSGVRCLVYMKVTGYLLLCVPVSLSKMSACLSVFSFLSVYLCPSDSLFTCLSAHLFLLRLVTDCILTLCLSECLCACLFYIVLSVCCWTLERQVDPRGQGLLGHPTNAQKTLLMQPYSVFFFHITPNKKYIHEKKGTPQGKSSFSPTLSQPCIPLPPVGPCLLVLPIVSLSLSVLVFCFFRLPLCFSSFACLSIHLFTLLVAFCRFSAVV